MRQLTIAAALGIATLVAAGPERINGGPLKQNGQCWRSHGGASEAAWGFWQPCAQPASTSTTHATHQATRHHT
jgi:hypothetical protein